MEYWRTCIECPRMQVSNLGNVRTTPEIISFGEVKKPFSRRLRPKKYGRYLYVNFNRRSYNVARLVANAFVSNPEHLDIVTFIDGNCYNVRDTNLRWSSRKDIMKHTLEQETYKRSRGRSISIVCEELGTKYPNVKHCLEDVERALNIHINYDTMLRHLKKSDSVCLLGIHFHKTDSKCS